MPKILLFMLCIGWIVEPSSLASQGMPGDSLPAVEAVPVPKSPIAVADMSWSVNALHSIPQYQDRLTAGARVEKCARRNLCFHGGAYLGLDNLWAVTPLDGNAYFLHGAVGVKPRFHLPLLGDVWGLPSVGVTREKLPNNPISYYGFVAVGVAKNWDSSRGRVTLIYEQIVHLFNVNQPGSSGVGIHDIRTVAMVRGLHLGTKGLLKGNLLDIILEGGHVKETPGESKYSLWTLNGTLRFGSTLAPFIMIGTRPVLSLTAPRMEPLQVLSLGISIRTKGF